jgi:hypothetical protein
MGKATRACHDPQLSHTILMAATMVLRRLANQLFRIEFRLLECVWRYRRS